MAVNRVEALKDMLAQDPANSRVRYMLATEYVNSGNPGEAIAEFDSLLAADPDYVAGYFHAARASESLGRMEPARAYYVRGIEAATRTGDSHALSELRAALEVLG
jgi:predicted Zn-dependent protease